MTFVPINIGVGLIADDTSLSIGQRALKDCSNVRPWRGFLEVVGGWELASLDSLEGLARSIHIWDGPTELLIAIGTHTKLYILKGSALTDITPAAFVAGEADGLGGNGFGTGAYGVGNYGEPSLVDSFAMTWSLANRGTQLIANPRGQGVFKWDEGDTLATPLANAPTECTFMRVTPQRQIMAYGTQEEVSGTFNPRVIRYSDIIDPTDWTTGTADNAGEFPFEDSGRIVSAIELQDSALVFTDSSVYQEDFIGSVGQTYDYRRLGSKSGLCGPNAVCELSGQVYFLDRQFKLWVTGLNQAPMRVISPVATDLFDKIDPIQRDKITLVSLAEYQEVWIFYQSKDGDDVDSYVAFNAASGLWFKGDFGRTAFHDATPFQYPIGIDAEGRIYYHEKGHSADGSPLAWYAHSGDITLSLGNRSSKIKGVRPDFEDQVGNVTLKIYEKPYTQSDKEERLSVSIASNAGISDFLYNGLFSEIRIEGRTSPARCRFGTLTFDMKSGGRR